MKIEELKKDGRVSALLIVLCVIAVTAFVLSLIPQNEENQQATQVNPAPTKNVLNSPSKSERVPGQVIIKFKPGLTDQQINQELQKYNAKILKKIDKIDRTLVEVPTGQEDQILKDLSQNPIVQNAEPNYVQRVFFIPNDQYFPHQWALANTGQAIKNQIGKPNADLNVESAWDVTKGSNIKVAILDTGIDMGHPDLAGKVVGQWIFTTSSIDDRFGHGTHVAGIIAADTNNGQGVAGVCPDCQLLIGKAMDDNGIGNTATIAQAIIWAADNGAKVINLSEGGTDYTQAQQDAINYAWNKGAIVVAAAGNSGVSQEFYPAAMNNVLSVGATNNNDEKAYFSNYGSWVQVAAPGQDIFSTLPTQNFAMQNKVPLALNYDYLSGTSMSTPYVSGVAALVWASQYGTSNSGVVQRLISTADKITGTGTYWLNGRINAGKAVGAVTQPSQNPSPSNAISPTPQSNPTTAQLTPTITPLATPTPTCTPRPICLDSKPACALPEPKQGWCQTIPTPTQGISPTISAEPTSPYVIPTLYCLGSCPTPTPTPKPNVPTVTNIPTSGQTTTPTVPVQPLTPQPSSVPSISPCADTNGTQSVTAVQQQPTDQTAWGRSRHQKRRRRFEPRPKRDGFFKQLFDILKKLLGNGGGQQPAPTPGPTPCPTEIIGISPIPTTNPSIIVSTTPIVNPTDGSISTIPSVSSIPTPQPSDNSLIGKLLDFLKQILELLGKLIGIAPSTAPSQTPQPTVMVPSVMPSSNPTIAISPIISTTPSASPSIIPSTSPTTTVSPSTIISQLPSIAASPIPSTPETSVVPSSAPAPSNNVILQIIKTIIDAITNLINLLLSLIQGK